MNTPSPLVPQGTQPRRGKSSLYFKVLMIVTVHVVLIGGMLLQGCKDTAKDQTKDTSISQAGTDTTAPTNLTAVPDTSVPPISASSISNQAMSTAPATQSMAAQQSAPPAVTLPSVTASTPSVPSVPAVTTGDGREYIIAKGDTLAAIAKRNSITLRALTEANPGVNPRKLRVGQKLEIPASTGAVASANASSGSSAPPAAAETPVEGGTYTVKSGDTLGRIARAHGTSYKKIMALNDLKTTAIRVGQKLKMPAPKPAGAEPMPAAAAITPTPGPVSAVSTPGNGVAN